MSNEEIVFLAEPDPSSETCAAAAELQPANPFLTPQYLSARRSFGDHPYLIGLACEKRWNCASLAFRRKGRLNQSLEIPSLAVPSATEQFWTGLRDFCQRESITELHLDTFASHCKSIPAIWPAMERRPRRELILSLASGDLSAKLSSNHKRNIKLAQRSGLAISRTTTPEACETHASLVKTALDRLRARGASVTSDIPLSAIKAFTENRAAELVQVVRGAEVLASSLLLKAAQGAYYHSAGTSDSAREVGAAHFLIYETAILLQQDDLKIFNLGGSDDPGLDRFKAGFGAEPVDLEAATVYLGGSVRRMIGQLLQQARGLGPLRLGANSSR
jgi:Acetyltransferase (GNAT) domain